MSSLFFFLPLGFLEGVLSFGSFSPHLLKGIDRFLLSSNHIELFPLDPGLLFELPSRFLGSSRHVSKGGCLWTRIWRLGFNDGRVLIIHLNSPGQQTIVDWGNCSRAGLSVLVNPFRFDKNVIQTWRSVNVRLLWTDSQLFSFRLAWCETRPHHVCSHFWVLDVREWFFLPGSFSLGWVWSRWQPAKNRELLIWKPQWQSESTAEMKRS